MNVLKKNFIYIYIYFHALEHHSAIKKYKLLIHTTVCMNCKSIACSKRSQSQLYFAVYNSGMILYQSLGVGLWGDYKDIQTFPGGSDGKESACSAGDPGLIPGSGSFSGEGNGYPLQYSGLKNCMDREAWWAIQSMGSQRVRQD